MLELATRLANHTAHSVTDAQQDLRYAFVGGGPGVFMSAMIWLSAALVARNRGIGSAFIVLFFGGMLIVPVARLVCRFLFGRSGSQPTNYLGRVALESTFIMIGGLFAAWLFLPIRPAYVFPLSAIAAGTHYAVFRTVYGDFLYWILGGLMTIIGVVTIVWELHIPGGPILAVGIVELLFSVLLTTRAAR